MFFFFQAEDGIRDSSVTGVQTCALPIWRRRRRVGAKYGEPRDLAGPVGMARWRADAGPGPLAVADPAVAQLLNVGLVGRLIVGGVKLRLGVVEKDPRRLSRHFGSRASFETRPAGPLLRMRNVSL